MAGSGEDPAQASRIQGDPVGAEHDPPDVVVTDLTIRLRAGERLSREVVGFVQRLREEALFKNPGVAETLDWAVALTELDKTSLDPETVAETLGVLLKYQDDIARMDAGRARALLEEVRAEADVAV